MEKLLPPYTSEYVRRLILSQNVNKDPSVEGALTHEKTLDELFQLFRECILKGEPLPLKQGEYRALKFAARKKLANSKSKIPTQQFSGIQENNRQYVTKGELDCILKKATQRIEKELQLHYEGLRMSIQHMLQNKPQKIALPSSNTLLYIEEDDIHYLIADRMYTKVYLLSEERPILLSKSLSKVHAFATGKQFIRIHKSYVINLNHIKILQRNNGGIITMKDGKELSISLKYKEAVITAINEMLENP